MKTNNKRKTGGKKPVKKSYLKSVHFLVTSFCCLFVFLAFITFNAMTAQAGSASMLNLDKETEADYTSFFDFKNGSEQTLTLTLGSNAATDLLVIDTDKAIKSVLVTNTDGSAAAEESCVAVHTNPFAIETRKAGEARVYVTAKMKNQTLCQKWIRVVVKNNTIQEDSQQDKTPVPVIFELELICNVVSDFGKTKELDFFVINKKYKPLTPLMSLKATVLQGSVSVDISGYTATLTFFSFTSPCIIKFSATVNEGNAEFLFVNPAS